MDGPWSCTVGGKDGVSGAIHLMPKEAIGEGIRENANYAKGTNGGVRHAGGISARLAISLRC